MKKAIKYKILSCHDLWFATPPSAHCDGKFKLHLEESLGQARSATGDGCSGNTKPPETLLPFWLHSSTPPTSGHTAWILTVLKQTYRNAQVLPWGTKDATKGRVSWGTQLRSVLMSTDRVFPQRLPQSPTLTVSSRTHRHFTSACSVCWPVARTGGERPWPLLCFPSSVSVRSSSRPCKRLHLTCWRQPCQTPRYPSTPAASPLLHATCAAFSPQPLERGLELGSVLRAAEAIPPWASPNKSTWQPAVLL